MNISHLIANYFIGLVAVMSVSAPFAMATGLIVPA
jgi:hypothetical protein